MSTMFFLSCVFALCAMSSAFLQDAISQVGTIIMNGSEIPKSYKCFLTNKVMKDPVVVLQTGEICDRSSISQIMQSNTTQTIPLPDLQSAIEQYLQIYQNNQSEEVFIQQDVEEIASSSNASNFDTSVKVYEQKVEEVKKQISLVSGAFAEIPNDNERVDLTYKSLKSQSDKLSTMANTLKMTLDPTDTAEVIQEVKNNLVETGRGIGLVINDECNKISEMFVKKHAFEKKLVCLEQKERELANLRQEFSTILKNLGIQPTFTTEFEACSKKYRELPKIDLNELQETAKNGFVGNVCVNIESNQQCEDIIIQGEVTLQNVTFTNAKNGAEYVGFFIVDDNTKITFRGCKFDGIGVIIRFAQSQKRGDVIVRNTEFKDVLDQAISIQNCNKCIIEHVKVQGCGYQGIDLEVTEGSLEDVHVQDCGSSGMFIQDVTKSIIINNSSIRNCKQFGLFIQEKHFNVQGTNLTFENNAAGNIRGNLRQN